VQNNNKNLIIRVILVKLLKFDNFWCDMYEYLRVLFQRMFITVSTTILDNMSHSDPWLVIGDLHSFVKWHRYLTHFFIFQVLRTKTTGEFIFFYILLGVIWCLFSFYGITKFYSMPKMLISFTFSTILKIDFDSTRTRAHQLGLILFRSVCWLNLIYLNSYVPPPR